MLDTLVSGTPFEGKETITGFNARDRRNGLRHYTGPASSEIEIAEERFHRNKKREEKRRHTEKQRKESEQHITEIHCQMEWMQDMQGMFIERCKMFIERY